jgi:hypothetical protein
MEGRKLRNHEVLFCFFSPEKVYVSKPGWVGYKLFHLEKGVCERGLYCTGISDPDT